MKIARSVVMVLATSAIPGAVCARAEQKAVIAPSAIDVQPKGDVGFLLTLKSYRSGTVTAGQEELMAKAAALCAPKRASFGRYAFDLQEPVSGAKGKPTILVLRQDVECGLPPSAVPSTSTQASSSNVATPEQVRRVEQQTQLYFDAKDHGRHSGAYDLMSPSMRQSISFSTWRDRAAAFNVKAGPVRQRVISNVTWYRDPPQVPPGLYAAVDFTSKFAEIDLHCGFLAWHEQSDGKFVLVREEENYLDRKTMQSLTPADLAKIERGFRCK
ncbi:DUF4019 domain-containing protein [Massilia sp. PAMC28688]|uniref:DUF4019 domain-containing protein n=1 Tax=Massilia sp. PAMC28688 TaxID=2861283 RepID=UPI001C634497|nr:DUF4019 domain-containing protein [Massilia sp. PAMC28688]QYF92640.1 DUF4019 domain-containing protein [Massilia sp. PAMC28688]